MLGLADTVKTNHGLTVTLPNTFVDGFPDVLVVGPAFDPHQLSDASVISPPLSSISVPVPP